jgi:nicotinamidase-related amidase
VPVDLAALLAPSTSVLVTQECQRGVIGESSVLPELAFEARRQAVGNVARLAAAARRVGVPVVHCLALRHPDGLGANTNARLFRAVAGREIAILPGSPDADVVDEIGTDPHDLVLARYHGLGPMGGTELDAVLRNMGVTTVVGVGVSVNVAIPSFVMDAVNAGYQFVLPRDAVAGVPREWADQVIDRMLSLMATVTTTDEVLAAWDGHEHGRQDGG